MHTIVCQVLEQVKQVILGVLIFSSHPILITPSSNTVECKNKCGETKNPATAGLDVMFSKTYNYRLLQSEN